jgi:hypothetical protein
MGIEGMWKFQSGSVQNPSELKWGGIVNLETDRVFGGDSAIAYRGTYQLDGKVVTAEVYAWQWNRDAGPVTNVFGMSGPIEHRVSLTGTIDGDVLEGEIWTDQAPGLRLPIRMEKIAELP